MHNSMALHVLTVIIKIKFVVGHKPIVADRDHTVLYITTGVLLFVMLTVLVILGIFIIRLVKALAR